MRRQEKVVDFLQQFPCLIDFNMPYFNILKMTVGCFCFYLTLLSTFKTRSIGFGWKKKIIDLVIF